MFFADWAELFDFTRVEWLEQEAFPDPPAGRRRTLDLVAKLPTRRALTIDGERTEAFLTLIHVEIESADTVVPLRRRMFRSYTNLRDRHDLPLPIGVYLRVGLEGLGVDSYAEDYETLEVVRFQYLYVGLPKLDAIEYMQSQNWLGVALSALMRVPAGQKPWLKAETLQRLVKCPENELRKFLLAECVQAYLPIDQPGEQAEFEQLVQKEPYREVRAMATTWYEQGVEKGREEGHKEGRKEERRAVLSILLEERFGKLSPAVRQRLNDWPAAGVAKLIRKALKARSLAELSTPAIEVKRFCRLR